MFYIWDFYDSLAQKVDKGCEVKSNETTVK